MAAAVAQAEILEAAEEQSNVPDDKSAKKSLKEECMQRTSNYVTKNYSHCDDFVPVKQEESLVTWDKILESSPLIPHPQIQVKSSEECMALSDSYFSPLKTGPNTPENNNQQWSHPQSDACISLNATTQHYAPLYYASQAESIKAPDRVC